ncbi:hypothetical protein C8J57DRAFT_1606319 [Mycena rebaudengoi]|nr:hypothetical protein C8J57DRAFT_1606319 [Mycena rebaudengoi]
MSSDSTPQRDLSLLCTEFQSIVTVSSCMAKPGPVRSSIVPLHELQLLKDCKLKPDELKLRVHKFNIVMKNSKQFLDSCDSFLQSLANMNAVAGPVYEAVKFIVTIAAAKSDILDGMSLLQLELLFIDAYVTEVLGGLNDVFDGLPLITHSVKVSKPSNPEHRAIISALTAFVTFVIDVKGFVGVKKDESIKQRVMRTFKSTTILRDVRDARRKKMRDALDLAHFGVLVNFTKVQSERYLRTLIGSALERLHCTNYEHHLDQKPPPQRN